MRDMMDLKKEITATHMMLVELKLYLNTHPSDCDAVSKHNAYLSQFKMLMDEYNKCYGMLNAHDAFSPCPWQWINEPWPWEYEANFNL